ncbi:hypothetical protein Vadar_017427 [Vaccinium darrowii]|uniref:Uncharacterized protein n=1 Tax=Vaccinium darrowii TaxID=229202 RepID=A0ACB7YE99_9ERIC|nr:hypothetical protein Vadar_017427 [Vaccinium darrowii]
MFSMSTHQLDELHSKTSVSDKLVSIEDYMNGNLMERTSRYGKEEEVLELGMQEIRTYFRLTTFDMFSSSVESFCGNKEDEIKLRSRDSVSDPEAMAGQHLRKVLIEVASSYYVRNKYAYCNATTFEYVYLEHAYMVP